MTIHCSFFYNEFLVLIIKKTNTIFFWTIRTYCCHTKKTTGISFVLNIVQCSHEKQWHSIMLFRLNHSSYSITKSWNVLSELFILKLTGNKNFEAQYIHSSAWNSLAMALKHEEAISKKKELEFEPKKLSCVTQFICV